MPIARAWTVKVASAFVVLLSCVLWPKSAFATIVMPQKGTPEALQSCWNDNFYGLESPDAPAIVKTIFRERGKALAVQTCTDVDGNVHYYLRKLRPNRNGICRVFEDEIFPSGSKDYVEVSLSYENDYPNLSFQLNGWKSSPPAAWTLKQYRPASSIFAQLHYGDCPPPDNDRYVLVGEMTDGMLKNFYSAWNEIKSSRERFDKAFGGIKFGFDSPLRVPMVSQSMLFREVVLHGKPNIFAIVCGAESNCEASLFSDRAPSDQTKLYPAVAWSRWSMKFDFTSEGLKFTHVEPIAIP